MTLDPKVAADLTQLETDLGAQAAPTDAPPLPDWWRPTVAQTAAFAAKVGLSLASVIGYPGTGTNTSQEKAPPVAAGDVATAMLYASFGFRPDGVHYLWTQDWIVGQRDFADQIALCPDAPSADKLLPGAGAPGVTTDAVVFSLMTGLTTAPKFTPFINPKYSGGQTVAAILSGLQAQTTATPGGPGPSGS